MTGDQNTSKSGSNRMLALSTAAFTICFASWMINGVLVTFLVNNGVFKWTPIQIGWLLGTPVLMGSVLRLPVGMLTDRYGGRWVMSVILFFCAIPMFFLSQANSYSIFLLLSIGFGITGASFASGTAYVSLWFPKEKQGTALGLFGVGNMGAALTTMLAPSILTRLTHGGTQLENWRLLPKLYAGLLVITGIIFLIGTINKKPASSRTILQRLSPLKEIRVWRFGLYYFFVFGSFVALSQWLIPYYVNVYAMSIVTAGFMATAFSLPSSILRAVGGWLADRVGARIVLLWVFGICIVCMVFLFVPRMEIQAPGQGVMADKPGRVALVTESSIVINEETYRLQAKEADSSEVSIRFGIHHDKEGFLLLPTTSFHQIPVVKEGEEVVKGQLLARGITLIYFQANQWIFSALVFIIGIMMGLGGAAVFKHIADFYPANMGTVGGIVGMLGGLGGFMGPIFFGYLLKASGIWTSCWMFLALLAAACLIFQRLAVKAGNRQSGT